MAKLAWSRRALRHLRSIERTIARDAPRTAKQHVRRLKRAPERLRKFPESGWIVEEFADPTIREIVHGNYRIVYRFQAKVVVILAVWHAAKILDPDLLSQED